MRTSVPSFSFTSTAIGSRLCSSSVNERRQRIANCLVLVQTGDAVAEDAQPPIHQPDGQRHADCDAIGRAAFLAVDAHVHPARGLAPPGYDDAKKAEEEREELRTRTRRCAGWYTPRRSARRRR